jgi:hypothetical protein
VHSRDVQACRVLLGLVATLLAGVVTGCSAPASPSRPTDGLAPPSISARPESHHRLEVQVVRSIDVGPGDLPSEFGSKNTLANTGNLVIGEVTMNVCGADFFSEVLRTARHQVGYASDKEYVSTETVSYRDGGASMAMRELRRAIRTCPAGYVDRAMAGVPPMRQQVEPLPHPARWLPDTVAFAVTDRVKGLPDPHWALIYQHRGNLVTAAYVYAGSAFPGLATHVASLLASRLEAATGHASSGS